MSETYSELRADDHARHGEAKVSGGSTCGHDALAPRVLTSKEQLAEIDGAWERLRSSLPAPMIEQHRGWLETQASTTDGMMVVTLGHDAEVKAIAPFFLKRWRLHCRLGYTSVASFRMRVARLCGDNLLAPDDEALQEALLEAVAGAKIPYSTLMVEDLRVDSPLRRRIDRSAAIRRNFWIHCPSPPQKHWLLRLPDSMSSFNTWLGPKHRSQLKSKERKLSAACGSPVRLERVTRPDEVPAYLEAVSTISKLSWQGRKLGQKVEAGDKQSVRIAEYAAKGWLRGYVLRSDNAPIAFVIGFQSDGTFYYMQVGYDPNWAAYSPGNVTLYRLIEDLYAHDTPAVVDYGGGDNQYKRVFGNDSFDEQSVFLMRRTPYTALARATHSTCVWLTDVVRSGLQRSGLLERVRRILRSA
jgi:CelD/BcsL family acetyltransferase involved in cellulose biosynthesis